MQELVLQQFTTFVTFILHWCQIYSLEDQKEIRYFHCAMQNTPIKTVFFTYWSSSAWNMFTSSVSSYSLFSWGCLCPWSCLFILLHDITSQHPLYQFVFTTLINNYFTTLPVSFSLLPPDFYTPAAENKRKSAIRPLSKHYKQYAWKQSLCTELPSTRHFSTDTHSCSEHWRQSILGRIGITC